MDRREKGQERPGAGNAARNNEKRYLPWLKAALLGVLLVFLSLLVWRELPRAWLGPGRIRVFLEGFGPVAPAAYMLLRVVGVLATVFPNAALDVAAGVVFGPFRGTLYSLAGAEAGAIVSFLVARALGREAIARLLKKDISFCDQCAQRQLGFLVFLARLEPIFSFALVSYGAGLTKISLRAFALGTLLGMLPSTILLNYYGTSFFFGFHPVLQICLGLAFVALFFVVPIWIKRKNPWGLYDRMVSGGRRLKLRK